MQSFLTTPQLEHYGKFREFVASHVEPSAGEWDRAQGIPSSIISLIGATGFMGSTIPVKYGGRGWDTVTFGLLNEAFGRSSSALTDLLTVQAMVSMTLVKWGTEEQKGRWLPGLARGELIGAFALTEPGGGSDLQSIKTEFRKKEESGGLLLNGHKTWISYGQSAGVFLVFGMFDQKAMACLVPREAAGLHVTPIENMLGFRAAGLAQVQFKDVEIPSENVIGKPDTGLSYVAPIGLLYGRISTAHSALGLLRACFEASTAYASIRRSRAGTVGDLGMIRSMVACMGTDLHAGRLLCHDACVATEDHSPEAYTKSLMAKYFTSKASVRAASSAVQILGAAGCHEDFSPIPRYYRDAKIMEIIEGTTQVHEDILGKSFMDAAPKNPCPL